MRRTVAGITVVAALCGIAVILCVALGLSFMERSGLFGDQSAAPSEAQVEKGQPLAAIGYSLVTLAGPLVGGVLVAVIAILGLLAFRWELRRRP